jgi:hypothetical protein
MLESLKIPFFFSLSSSSFPFDRNHPNPLPEQIPVATMSRNMMVSKDAEHRLYCCDD